MPRKRSRAQRRAEVTRKRAEENRTVRASAKANRPLDTEKLLRRQESDWDVVDRMPHYVRLRAEAEEIVTRGRRYSTCRPRALAVIRYIDLALGQHVPGSSLPRDARNSGFTPKRLRSSRHMSPARTYANERQRLNEAVPDLATRSLRSLVRRVEDEAKLARPEEGIGHGPLRVAAEHFVQELQLAHGLIGEEHRVALTDYLEGVWGEIVHAFPAWPVLPTYERWRERSIQRIFATGSIETDQQIGRRE